MNPKRATLKSRTSIKSEHTRQSTSTLKSTKFSKAFDITAQSTTEGLPEKKIADQIYYHGFRGKTEALNSIVRDGEYLVVGAYENDRMELHLCFRSRGKKYSVLIGFSKSELTYRLSGNLRNPRFRSIPDLIEYYTVNEMPKTENKLLFPVPRPIWMITEGNVKLEKKIGSGNFADVYFGYYNGRKVAAKRCKGKAGPGEEKDGSRVEILKEAHLMNFYCHENVIEFIGASCDQVRILLLMEFCDGGSLDSLLKGHDDIHELEKSLYAMEAARGMRYLHAQGCIHRDLAARNCLISSGGLIKIADFGLSMYLGEPENEDKNKNMPLKWMAPETISRHPKYAPQSDVWAFGVMCFEIFNNGIPPFAEIEDNKLIGKRIRKGDMPEFPDAPNVISNMITGYVWKLEPSQRPLFPDIFKTLVEMLFSRESEFPPVKQLVINQLPGVERPKVFLHTKPVYLLRDILKPLQ